MLKANSVNIQPNVLMNIFKSYMRPDLQLATEQYYINNNNNIHFKSNIQCT